ncbi:hypothetical protein [Prevotella sp.]|uniref:hypothetical protein n=1 Tax=Prevotella sp. TaxID=59823 RepID=UPI003DA51CE5
MNKIYFDFENCFGIAKMNAEIDFSQHNTAMIYAPNGTMKTSFANTLHALAFNAAIKAKGKTRSKLESIVICDRLHPNLQVKTEVKIENGVQLDPLDIFVANPDNKEYDATESVSTFLASTDLKQRYEEAIKTIDIAKNAFLKKYKDVSVSSDCEEELVAAFGIGGSPSIYDIIELLNKKINEGNHQLYHIKYNSVFDKKGIVKKFLDENQEKLAIFVSQYNNLLSRSQFFHVSEDGKNTFGTYQAKTLSNGLKDDSFFKVKHKLQLQDNSSISSYIDLDNKIKDEIKKVEEDERLQAIFIEITSKLDVNPELRAFKNCIKDNKGILSELVDYESFRLKVLLGYFSDINTLNLFNELHRVYLAKKNDLAQILQEAKAEQDRWKNIVDLFNARFYVPFEAKIENQEDIILRAQTPKLTFVYHNKKGEDIKKSRLEILQILSKGEMRAFFILQMLFEIEARKDNNKQILIVLDDISDSFDYQNKFAIIEYLNDLSKLFSDKFKVILLTHNFDFYRNATLRLGIKKCYMTKKDDMGKITLEQGIYIMKTPLENEIRNSNVRSFISMIPFTRNIAEYTEGAKFDEGHGVENNDFMKLTQCLHLKTDTLEMTDSDVDTIIRKHIKNPKYQYSVTGAKIIDIIYNEAKAIAEDNSPMELAIEDKVVLSIAIRLMAENYMKTQLIAAGESEDSLKTSDVQTTFWFGKMKEKLPTNPKLNLLERVNMMTPECIHINSFMYEPLIDMSIRHLVNLYNEVIIM